jgi:hypothetical protein
MFDFIKKKVVDFQHKTNPTDRPWLDLQYKTFLIVEDIFKDTDRFHVLCGAIFALHQDAVEALGLDLRATEDRDLCCSLNPFHPDLLTDFDDRVEMAMQSMREIETLNNRLVASSRPAHIDQREFMTHVIYAGLRLMAARVWMLTMNSKKTDNPNLKKGIVTIWTMLQSSEDRKVLECAELFVGTYFNDVKTDPLDIVYWPYYGESVR